MLHSNADQESRKLATAPVGSRCLAASAARKWVQFFVPVLRKDPKENLNRIGARVIIEWSEGTELAQSSQPKRVLITTLNFAVAGLVLAGIALVPRGDRLTVVVAPWSSPGHVMDVIKEAGGSLVESSALSWVVVSQGQSSDFAQRLYSAGAIMVLDGSLLAGCFKRGI